MVNGNGAGDRSGAGQVCGGNNWGVCVGTTEL